MGSERSKGSDGGKVAEKGGLLMKEVRNLGVVWEISYRSELRDLWELRQIR